MVLLDDVQAGVGAMCTSMRFEIGTPRWWTEEARTWSSIISCPTNGLPRQASGDGRHTHALQHSNNVLSKSSTSAAVAKRSNDARPSPVLHHTLRSLKATILSIAKRIDVPEHHRAEQGHHCQHGGRASVRLYGRDDLWGALACQQLVVQKVTEGFRPLTAQGRGAQIPLTEPAVQIDPPITPKWYPMTLTARRSHTRKPRRSVSQPPANPEAHPNCRRPPPPPPTPGNAEELTDASITPSESSTFQDRGASPRDEGGVIRECNAMHEENVFRSWLRE